MLIHPSGNRTFAIAWQGISSSVQPAYAQGQPIEPRLEPSASEQSLLEVAVRNHFRVPLRVKRIDFDGQASDRHQNLLSEIGHSLGWRQFDYYNASVIRLHEPIRSFKRFSKAASHHVA